MSQEQQELTFPILKQDEIIYCLKELDIKVGPEISKPTLQVVQPLYDSLLRIIFSTKPNVVDDYDLLGDSVEFLTLYKNLQKVTVAFGCPVAIKDLLNPTRKRTAVIISCVLNFIKFREEKLVLYEQLSQKQEVLQQSKRKMAAEIEAIQQKVAECKAKRNQELPMLNETKGQSAQVQKEIKELKDVHVKTLSQFEDLKMDKAKLLENLNNNNLLIDNLGLAISKLKNSIIDDPVALKNNLKTSAQMLDKDKQMLAELKKTLLNLSIKHKNFAEIEGELCIALETLNSLEMETEKQKEAQKEMMDLQDQFKKRGVFLQETENRIGQLLKITANSKDKLKRLDQHYTVRKEQNNSKLQKLYEELETIKKMHEDAIAKSVENDQQSAQLEEKVIYELNFSLFMKRNCVKARKWH